ncbi:MAG: hypothetical protein NVS4B3_13290 [Gemmatimonadaceae bacterium]
MGIWGADPFASDEALDWLQGLAPGGGSEPAVAALRDLVGGSDPYLEAGRASVGLAAAELVAALRGCPHAALPEPARAWVAARPNAQPDGDTLSLAVRAVDYIVTSSQLSEIYSQRSDESAWRSALDDLRMRLTP